jgi:hypothetical protein
MYGNNVPVEKAVDCFVVVCRNRQLLCVLCCKGLVLYMG